MSSRSKRILIAAKRLIPPTVTAEQRDDERSHESPVPSNEEVDWSHYKDFEEDLREIIATQQQSTPSVQRNQLKKSKAGDRGKENLPGAKHKRSGNDLENNVSTINLQVPPVSNKTDVRNLLNNSPPDPADSHTKSHEVQGNNVLTIDLQVTPVSNKTDIVRNFLNSSPPAPADSYSKNHEVQGSDVSTDDHQVPPVSNKVTDIVRNLFNGSPPASADSHTKSHEIKGNDNISTSDLLLPLFNQTDIVQKDQDNTSIIDVFFPACELDSTDIVMGERDIANWNALLQDTEDIPHSHADDVAVFQGEEQVLDSSSTLTARQEASVFSTPVSSSAASDCSNSSGKRSRKSTPREVSSRKRQTNRDKWRSYQCKLALDSGEEHRNLKGALIPAREMRDGCRDKCRNKCQTLISREVRTRYFKAFWALKNHTRQWDFINKHTLVTSTKQPRQRLDIEEESRRKHSHQYFFMVDTKVVKVCKTMFLGTLGISDTWVKTAVKKLNNSASISPDKRGRHSKVNLQVSSAVKDSIRVHINLFPRVESHYTRQRTKREYLEEGLNIRKMFRLYCEWMTSEERAHEKKGSERNYRDIFNNEFNIGFFRPKKDQCDLCNVFMRANPAQKLLLQERFDIHQLNKKLARDLKEAAKKRAKEDMSVCFACFDLQKVLTTPKTETSALYYKRKLSLYNFTVFDGGELEGFCYVWHEALAKRGANEIASAVLSFIETEITAHKRKEFLFFADNCSGQNKNRQLFSMFRFASAKYGIKITLRFLEKGHTQNEGDSMHAKIEVESEGKELFVPNQWYEVIKQAKKTGKPYVLKELTQDDIFNFKPLVDAHQWVKDMSGSKVNWLKVREVTTDCHGNEIGIKYSFSEEVCTVVPLSKRTRGRPMNLASYQLTCAYSAPLHIPAPKMKDLASLCEMLIIPSEYHDFYKSLRGFPEDAGSTEVDNNNPEPIDGESASHGQRPDQEEEQSEPDNESDGASTDYEDWLDKQNRTGDDPDNSRPANRNLNGSSSENDEDILGDD